jgi:signal transduction histidine kinase
MLKKIKNILVNPHFLIITVISLLGILLYRFWPWRSWLFPENLPQWMFWLYTLHELALFEAVSRVIGILFLIPIIYASVIFTWRGALYTSALAFIGILPIIAGWSVLRNITNLFVLCIPFLILSILTLERQRRQKDKERSDEKIKEYSSFLSRINEATERERLNLSQDLHDEIIQDILVVNRIADSLVSSSPSEIVKQNATEIVNISNSTIENLRRICLQLRPDILDRWGLVSASRWLVDQISKRSTIRFELCLTGEEHRLLPQIEISLFRVIQEALNNIILHSKAHNAIINIEFDKGLVVLTVKDDGQGFDFEHDINLLTKQGKMGIIGIKQRVEAVNGLLQIHSSPGEGTLLKLELKTDFIN